MKFPYGISDFNKIITKGYFYCDRTDKIQMLEDAGDSLLFLRPRRFGKSLLLSMLANYYDVALKDRFKELFGNLLIGKNPTENRNKYFILKLDFSYVDSSGNADDIKKSLYNHVNSAIEGFKIYYEDYIKRDIKINPEDALSSMLYLISIIRKTPYKIYLLIDEYDNFANTVMMGDRKDKSIYDALVYEDGPLKNFFKAIKASAGESLIDKTFITGVSPVVLSDITSGYNIAKNIYLKPEFNGICGFTEKEVEKTLKSMKNHCSIDDKEISSALDVMRKYYNGYSFSYPPSYTKTGYVYNPTLAIYFFDEFYQRCEYPINMLDSNLSMDRAKMEYVSQIESGRKMIFDLVNKDGSIEADRLEDRFGIQQMIKEQSKNINFMASFLYYFGVLTIDSRTSFGKIKLKVPNLVTRRLYAETLCEMLLPEPMLRDSGILAAQRLYQTGDIKPVCDFIETKYFKVFSNRDYIWASEMTVKTAFLTLLYNDDLYIMNSEEEADRNYTDLTMIIRPDNRKLDIFDVLLEFKYVKLSEAGINAKQARQLNPKELEAIPQMKEKMNQALARLKDYGDALEQKYGNLRLKRFAVVALGFERLWADA